MKLSGCSGKKQAEIQFQVQEDLRSLPQRIESIIGSFWFGYVWIGMEKVSQFLVPGLIARAHRGVTTCCGQGTERFRGKQT